MAITPNDAIRMRRWGVSAIPNAALPRDRSCRRGSSSGSGVVSWSSETADRNHRLPTSNQITRIKRRSPPIPPPTIGPP